MAILILLGVGAASAAAGLAIAVAGLLLFTVRGLRRRESQPEYWASVRHGYRYGLVGGMLAAWGVLAVALAYFRASRYVVVDNWWSLTWISNALAAGGVAVLALAWLLRSLYLNARGRRVRAQLVAASCAYLCLWASCVAAYYGSWRPWRRACAFRTIQEENFNPHIQRALQTFIDKLSPQEEQTLISWLGRADKPAARFNAAYILARRHNPQGMHAAAQILFEIDTIGTARQNVSARYEFPVDLARASIMEMTGFRTHDDEQPLKRGEWEMWKRWYQAQPSLANHYVHPAEE